MKKLFTTHKTALFLLGILTVLCLGLLCACVGGNPAGTTGDSTPAETQPVTDASTDVPTDAPTDTPTETPTEAPTEAVTLPADKPENPAELTFCDTPLNETFIQPNSAAEFSIVQDGEKGSVLKLSVADSKRIGDPYVKISYAAYMEAAGLDPVAWNDCAVAVVLLKVEGASSNLLEITAYNKSVEKSKNVKGSAYYQRGSTEWQYVMVPLVADAYDGTLTDLRLDFVDKPAAAGETVYVKSITFVKDKLTALQMTGAQLLKPSTATVEIPGLQGEFTFLHVTDTHVSAFSDADKKAWTATRLQNNTARRNSFAADGLFSEERFPLLFDYANEIGADGMFLTGDLIDFPSEKNITMLYENVKRFKGTSIFCLGNHDWNYSDDYMTGNAVATNRPLFNDLTGGDPYFSFVEYDGFIVAAVDNSSDVVTDDTVNKFLALYEKNKPIILLLHVPLHADTLAPDVKKAWGNRNITMGPGAMGSDWGSVIRFYDAVAVDEDSPVVAVFAGHVHFNHEDTLPNGITQYITSTGYTGDCRVVTVKGE